MLNDMPLSQEDNISINGNKSRGEKRVNSKGKLRVLSIIEENKTILFGPISDKETKDTRTEKWKEIFVLASSLKLVPANKDYLYLRDVFWQNCRKYAIAKLDNPSKLTACDDIVLNIIGRRCGEDDPKIDETISCSQITDVGASCSVTSTFNLNPQPQHVQGRKRVTKQEEHSFTLKKQKLLLEHLELANHKAKLEIALMEKQLGYPCSVFTNDLDKATAGTTDVTPKEEVAESSQYDEAYYADFDDSEETEDDNKLDKKRIKFVTDNKLIIDLLSK